MAKVEPIVSPKGGVVDNVVHVEDSETSGEVSVKDLVAHVASLRDRVDAQEKAMEKSEEVAKRFEEENQELRGRINSHEMEMKLLDEENRGLREQVDVQGKELQLIKQSLAGQLTAEGQQLEATLQKVVERGENAGLGEGDEAEELWALVDLPRASDVSAGWAALLAYMYTFVHAATCSFLLFVCLEWFPVTDFKSATGVPVMNVDVLVSRWYPVTLSVLTIGTAFNIIASWESGIRHGPPWNAAWPAFPITVVNGALLFSIFVATIAALRAQGFDTVYFARLDIIIFFFFGVLWVITTQILLRKAYHDWGWGPGAGEEEEGTKAKGKEKKEKSKKKQTKKKTKKKKKKKKNAGRRRSSVLEDEIRRIQEDNPTASILSTVFVLGGVTFNMALYPTLIIPYLNADTTTDFARTLVISVGLSLLTEGTLMVLRFGYITTSEEDFNIRAATRAQNVLFLFESMCILGRRILLGCMRSQQAVFFTIGIMSLEEAILRSTFAAREIWYRKHRGEPPASAAELARLKVGWAVQIANSMHCEIFSIIMAKLLVIASRWDFPPFPSVRTRHFH